MDYNILQKKERRLFDRWSFARIACSCAIRPEAGISSAYKSEKHGALVLNISKEGICFQADFEPSVGQKLAMEVHPIEGPEVRAEIRIIHVRNAGRDGSYIIGSKLEEINEQNEQNLLSLLDLVGRLEKSLGES